MPSATATNSSPPTMIATIDPGLIPSSRIDTRGCVVVGAVVGTAVVAVVDVVVDESGGSVDSAGSVGGGRALVVVVVGRVVVVTGRVVVVAGGCVVVVGSRVVDGGGDVVEVVDVVDVVVVEDDGSTWAAAGSGPSGDVATRRSAMATAATTGAATLHRCWLGVTPRAPWSHPPGREGPTIVGGDPQRW